MLRFFLLVFSLLFWVSYSIADDDPNHRRIMAPVVRAVTNCLADAALKSTDFVPAIRKDTLQDLLKQVASQCAGDINQMIALHDRLAGPGTGLEFFQGAYMNDLPRALHARFKPQIEAATAEYDRIEEAKRQAQAQRQTEAAKAEEARRQEAALREEERKADQDRRESALRIEQQKRDAEKAVALDTAKRAMGILRDKLYDCTDRNLATLVKSGEGAEVLASAVMTICRNELDSTLQSAIDAFKIDSNINYVNDAQQAQMRDELTKSVKDRLIASAVQAKAAAASTH